MIYNVGDIVLIKDYDEFGEFMTDHNNIPKDWWESYQGIGRIIRIDTTVYNRYYLLQNVYDPTGCPWFFIEQFFVGKADENERAQYDIEEGIR